VAGQSWSTIQNACIVACSQAPYPYSTVPADFIDTQFPQATSYAEDRINTDLALLNTRRADTSTMTTAGSRVVSLANVSPFITIPESFALISPAGQTNPAIGTRYGFDVASLDVIDLIWPNEATTLAPSLANDIGRFWALSDDHTIVCAPTPDDVYTCEIWGQFRPTPISQDNPTTYVSTYYSGLMIAACMVFLSGALLRNFGAMAEDPKMAQSWEAEYERLLPLAKSEEQRRRSQGVGWSADEPTPLTAPSART
jgi:hypothetical protein